MSVEYKGGNTEIVSTNFIDEFVKEDIGPGGAH